MNKIFAGLFVFLFLTAASAQANEGHNHWDKGDMVGKRVENLSKKLSLTDDQKGKVEGMLKEQVEKKHQLMEDNQKAMKALDDDFKTKLTGVLTPEQVKKWEAMKENSKGHCPDCKGGKMCDVCKKKKGMKDHDHNDHDDDHEDHDHDK